MIDGVMALEGQFHILIIDDGSPDGTADIVREKQDDYGPFIFLIEREKKLGLGDGSAKDDGIYVLMKEVIDNCIDEYVFGLCIG